MQYAFHYALMQRAACDASVLCVLAIGRWRSRVKQLLQQLCTHPFGPIVRFVFEGLLFINIQFG